LNVTPSIYRKRALKWTIVSLVLFAAAVVVRNWAWNLVDAGGAEVTLAFVLLAIFGLVATVAMGGAAFCALMARTGKR